MKFQIKLCKEYIKRDTTRLLKVRVGLEEELKSVEDELKFIQKIRDEINEANKLLRSLDSLKGSNAS